MRLENTAMYSGSRQDVQILNMSRSQNSNRLLSKEETLPYSDLNELVDKRIRFITRLAYDHNAFLHSLFRSAGMNPNSDVSGRSDLMKAYKLGVRTSGADIEKCYADFAPTVPLLEIWTSGSSGKPKKILVSRDGAEREVRGQEMSLISAGVMPGQKVLRLAAPPPHATSYTSVLHTFFPRLPTKTLIFRVPNISKNLGHKELEKIAQSFIDMIYDFNPEHVRGGVFALYKFANFLTNHGLDREKISRKSVILSGEPTTAEDRMKIGELWNSMAFDVYSSTETGPMAFECGLRTGLHVNESNLLLIAADSASGEEVGETELGKNLCTNLFAENKLPGAFLINYSHGDKISMLPDACSCGSKFRLMNHPSRDTKKKFLSGYGFDVNVQKSFLRRAIRKAHGLLH